jgi:hypothetical protein
MYTERFEMLGYATAHLIAVLPLLTPALLATTLSPPALAPRTSPHTPSLLPELHVACNNKLKDLCPLKFQLSWA